MSNEKNTFWQQMYQSGKIKRQQFSLCFSRQNVVDPAGTGAGAMTVGGTVTRLHKTPMVYASQVTSSRSFFTIYVENIFLQDAASANSNEKSAISNTDGSLHRLDISTNDLNSRGVIVDSGTTDSYFTSRLSKPFREVFEQLSGRKYSNSPMKLSLDEVMTLPAIVFQIRGVANYDYGSSAAKSTTRLVGDMDKSHGNDILVSVPPTHYMEYDDETQSYTPRIYLTESSGSVLGANVMQGHDVFFDLENSRIGFAESDCEYVPLDVTDASGAVEGSKKVQDDVTSPTKVENVDNTDAATATENSDTEGGSVVDGYGMISDSQSATHTDNGVHIMQQCSTNKCRGMAVIAISFIVCAAMLSIRAVRNRRATNAHRGEQGHRIRTNSEDSDTLTFGDADDEDAEEETFHPHSSPIV